MRYQLRTLLIVLALGPALIAGCYWGYGAYRQATMTDMERKLEQVSREIDGWIRQQKEKERTPSAIQPISN